jgi:hypothetical protein
MAHSVKQRRPLQIVLKIAGVYNILWGAWVVLLPLSFFHLTEMPEPIYPTIWQSVGMVVGVYGLGYWLASYHYIRHWPVVMVGFIGKLFGPIGILFFTIRGEMDISWAIITLFNDLIWIIPFSMILFDAYKAHQFRNFSDTAST